MDISRGNLVTRSLGDSEDFEYFEHFETLNTSNTETMKGRGDKIE
jgi:hypothetical protein